ncbi:MAG: isoprenylcysteine carboxylmethyltransferase family protein [Anaerolineae bacterium]|jgi:protein-S-isoprenylcysteine O-methyltransferase Ste14|nr:isoprenylcysteine carboxylmethyltransferase family protein [Anaerolineae bacterium]
MSENSTENGKLDQPLSIWFILLIPFYVAFFLTLVIILPGGDWGWLEGWILVISMSLNMGIGAAILNKKSPRVLRNRMKTKKEGLTAATKQSASSDRFIMPILSVFMLGSMVVSGLGHRFGWYTLPLWVSLLGAVAVNLSEILLQVVISQNAHASKVLDINQGQTLVDTGLYAHVRHPLYSAFSLMMIFWPIALGSVWGVPLSILSCLGLVVRIRFEEEMLLKGMEGYAEYRERVKYKLIPGIF